MKSSPLDLSPTARFWVLLLVYAIELTASLWMAYELRFDFMVEPSIQHERLVVLCWLIPLQLLLLGLFHQLNTLLGYFSTPDLARMFHALTISVVIAIAVWIVSGERYAPPRGVTVLDFIFCLVGLTGARLALRTFRESVTSSAGKRTGQRRRRVCIIGAGDAGAVPAHELTLKPGYGLDPVAFFDDDPSKRHSRVHDISVLGPPEGLLDLAAKLDIQEAIIAMPSAQAKRVGEIVRILRQARLECKTIPSSTS